MITKIYGLPACPKCEQARRLFPNAQYISIPSLGKKEQDYILERAMDCGQLEAPVLMDNTDAIIKHEKIGL